MAELWGSVVVSLLFWGFANEVTLPLRTLTLTAVTLTPTNPYHPNPCHPTPYPCNPCPPESLPPYPLPPYPLPPAPEQVTKVDEAKKYYPLFGLGANVALIFSGQVRSGK